MGIFRSLRKGCMQCGSPLQTSKEKFTRTCLSCAKKALEGFQDMSEGKLKSGFDKVLDASAASGIKEGIVRDRIAKATTKKRKTLEKKLRKQGLSDEQIKEGLEAFENVSKK